MQSSTLLRHSQGIESGGFYRVVQEDSNGEELNGGVDQHKVDCEACGWDEWMV